MLVIEKKKNLRTISFHVKKLEKEQNPKQTDGEK